MDKIEVFVRIPQNLYGITTKNLSYVVPVQSMVEIWQTFVAFSEYMNFNNMLLQKGFYPTVPTPLKLNTNDDESNNAE